MCSIIQNELSHLAKIDFKIQTNATLITDRWIDAFSKFNVVVGVSIDGPKEYNDIFRVDHRNKGSYDSVRQGIELLQRAAVDGRISNIGALCVIDPSRNARVIYRHFVDELKIFNLVDHFKSSWSNFGVKARIINDRKLQRIELIRCTLRSLRSLILRRFHARNYRKNF